MMAQFGGKNPPWARTANDIGQPGLQAMQQVAQQQLAQQQAAAQQQVVSQQQVAQPQVLGQPGVATPTVYSLASQPSQIAPHQYTQQQLQVASVQTQLPPPAVLPQPGIAIPTTLATTQVATVSYPTPRAAQQQPQPKQRVFTGTVTKLHDNFGFVDEDVFFQISNCVKGQQPKVGDRVLVEATFNANMPFKWNATRIQVLPNQHGGSVGNQRLQHHSQQNVAAAQPSHFSNDMNRAPPPLMAQPSVPPGSRQPIRGRNEMFSMRDRDRDRDRDRMRDRTERHERNERRRSPKRSRSPRRSRSPQRRSRSPTRNRRPVRIVPRYMVQIPKISLDTREANVIALRSRYTNLYVPSDFFNASFSWVDAFPMHRPFTLGQACSFHVMHKEVDPLERNEAVLEPADADHLYSAKVMLMASPSLEELYHKTSALAEDPQEARESFQHPTRLLQFLVGLKGKSEPMAIGGPWSPSLDGANPGEDPCVLIKTAIRTTRALTGIDLSNCTQWYRFAEMRYHRPEETHKGRVVPARVETVVLFLPDVWSCMPSRLDWQSMQTNYKNQLHHKIAEETKEDSQEDNEEDTPVSEKKDPTHYSQLDPKMMKVGELRHELECRTLNSKGLRSQLMARLIKALKTEQEKEEEEEGDKDEDDEEEKVQEEPEKPSMDEKEEERKKKEEEERKRKEERDRVARERRYILPDPPAIIVHPHPTAKSGKFDCTVMSLSVLLDYRPEDNKEHSFEVSLFAELFNEMIMRDFGFTIYKALLAAPERKEDEKKKKDDKKDKKKDEKKDDKKEDKDDKKEDKDDKKKDEKKDDRSEESAQPTPKKRRTDSNDDKKSSKDSKKKDSKNGDDEDEGDDDDADDDDDKKKKRDKVKYMTKERRLLLAFCYFDLTHTGYLLDKDVEEIMHTIGLHLSRSQVKKLVQKLVTRDTLNYRKLTDKPITPLEDEEGHGKEEEPGKEGAVAAAGGEEKMDTSDGGETGAPALCPELLDEKTLALGNKHLLPQIILHAKSGEAATDVAGAPRQRGLSECSGGETAAPLENTMVMYKGAMVDINSVMHRLERSEKTRTAVEDKLRETEEEMHVLKSSFNSSEQTSQKTALELSELKKKLRESKKSSEVAETKAKMMHDVIQQSHNTLQTLTKDFQKALGPPDVKVEAKDIKTEPKEEVNGES